MKKRKHVSPAEQKYQNKGTWNDKQYVAPVRCEVRNEQEYSLSQGPVDVCEYHSRRSAGGAENFTQHDEGRDNGSLEWRKLL